MQSRPYVTLQNVGTVKTRAFGIVGEYLLDAVTTFREKGDDSYKMFFGEAEIPQDVMLTIALHSTAVPGMTAEGQVTVQSAKLYGTYPVFQLCSKLRYSEKRENKENSRFNFFREEVLKKMSESYADPLRIVERAELWFKLPKGWFF